MKKEEVYEKYFKEGRLINLPRRLAAKQVLFSYFQQELSQKGQVFTEQEINEFLKDYYDDYAILRRYLVDYGYLTRDNYGQEYRIG